MYKGIQGKGTRTARTIAEAKGTAPSGFGSVAVSPVTGTLVGPGFPPDQVPQDPAAPQGLSTRRTNGVPDPKPF